MKKIVRKEIFPFIVRNDFNLVSSRDKTKEKKGLHSNYSIDFNKNFYMDFDFGFNTNKKSLNMTQDQERVKDYHQSKQVYLKIDQLEISKNNKSLFNKQNILQRKNQNHIKFQKIQNIIGF